MHLVKTLSVACNKDRQEFRTKQRNKGSLNVRVMVPGSHVSNLGEDRNRYDWTKESGVKVGTKTQERKVI
jgi:hypothetical protein